MQSKNKQVLVFAQIRQNKSTANGLFIIFLKQKKIIYNDKKYQMQKQLYLQADYHVI